MDTISVYPQKLSVFRFTILRKLALECSYFQAKENLGFVIISEIVSVIFRAVFVIKIIFKLNFLRFL
jgi:hypothetical protein